MTQSSNVTNQRNLGRLARAILAAAAVVTSSVALPWLVYHSPAAAIVQARLEGNIDQFTSAWRAIDRNMSQAAGSGNVALRFTHFDRANPRDVSIVQEAYFRGSYAIYPQRLLAAQEGRIIGKGEDLLQELFDPPLSWLRQNNVRAILNLTMLGDGSFSVQGQTVPAAGVR